MSISSRAHARSKSFCDSPNSAPRKTRTTPCLMLRLRSGIALFRSIAMVRPNPRHSGHAPRGLLKLKSPGVGRRMSTSHQAQCQPVEKGIAGNVAAAVSAAVFEVAGDTPASTEMGTTFTLPFPKRSPVSIASTNRARFSSLIVMRSWITCTRAPSRLIFEWPSTRTTLLSIHMRR